MRNSASSLSSSASSAPRRVGTAARSDEAEGEAAPNNPRGVPWDVGSVGRVRRRKEAHDSVTDGASNTSAMGNSPTHASSVSGAPRPWTRSRKSSAAAHDVPGGNDRAWVDPTVAPMSANMRRRTPQLAASTAFEEEKRAVVLAPASSPSRRRVTSEYSARARSPDGGGASLASLRAIGRGNKGGARKVGNNVPRLQKGDQNPWPRRTR